LCSWHFVAPGSTGFGTSTSFGAQPASAGLFGASANQAPAAGSIFGGGTSVFGQTQQQQQQQQQPASTFCEFSCNWLLDFAWCLTMACYCVVGCYMFVTLWLNCTDVRCHNCKILITFCIFVAVVVMA